MSTLMMLRAKVDPKLAEEVARGDDNPFARLANSRHDGLLRHRVFATEDELIVIDEWERAEDWQAWRAQPEVDEVFRSVLSQAGMSAEPDVTFAREIDLGDKVG